MPDIFIDEIDDETLRRLEEQAVRHGRTLEAEIVCIISDAVGAVGRNDQTAVDPSPAASAAEVE